MSTSGVDCTAGIIFISGMLAAWQKYETFGILWTWNLKPLGRK
jgi:hypothetical protein